MNSNETRRITFADSNGLIPLWYAVTCRPDEDEWNVVNVEVYADASLHVDFMVGEDLWDSIPQASQDAILAKLDEIEHERRQRQAHVKRELAAITMPMLANAHHPGPRCSCESCLGFSADAERSLRNALNMANVMDHFMRSFSR